MRPCCTSAHPARYSLPTAARPTSSPLLDPSGPCSQRAGRYRRATGSDHAVGHPRPPGPVQPRARARRLRCRLRRADVGEAVARHRAQGRDGAREPRAPRRVRLRARLGRRRRHPHPAPGRLLPAVLADRRDPAPAPLVRRRHRVPAPRTRPSRPPEADRGHRRRGGPRGRRLARAPGRRLDRRLDRPQRDAAVRAAVRQHPATASGMALERWPSACASAPSTRPASTSRRCRPHHRLQGHAHDRAARAVLPDLRRRALRVGASPWCTPASPRTRSRRWPLAHPYRLVAHNGEINTVRGNRNWMHAREALLASDLIPGDLARLFPICTPGRLRLGVLRRGARAAAPRRAQPAARRADDDPRGVGEPRRRWTPPRRAFYEFHASLMEPWDGPACVSLHRRHADRRGARPQRAAPGPLLGHRRRPGRPRLRGRRARHRPRARSCARAACSPGSMFLVDTEQAPHRRRRRDQGRAGRRAAVRRVARTRALIAPRRRSPSASTSCTRTESVAPSPADLRLHRGGAADPRRADGRRPVPSPSARWAPTRPIAVLSRPSAAALRLLRAALRPGHQPAAGRDPRRARHVAGRASIGPEGNLLDGLGRRHCRQIVLPFPVIDNDELAKILHINTDGDLPGFAGRQGLGPVRRRRRRERRSSAPRRDLRRGLRAHRRRCALHRALRPRLRRRHGADPVAAADLGGAPPPRAPEGTHQVGAGRRGRRRPRGAPRRAAHRLRRGRGQPLPRDRDASRTSSARHARRRRRRRGRRATSSRRSARASSR